MCQQCPTSLPKTKMEPIMYKQIIKLLLLSNRLKEDRTGKIKVAFI